MSTLLLVSSNRQLSSHNQSHQQMYLFLNMHSQINVKKKKEITPHFQVSKQNQEWKMCYFNAQWPKRCASLGLESNDSLHTQVQIVRRSFSFPLIRLSHFRHLPKKMSSSPQHISHRKRASLVVRMINL